LDDDLADAVAEIRLAEEDEEDNPNRATWFGSPIAIAKNRPARNAAIKPGLFASTRLK
jgi:hypothetical protein